MSNNIINLTKLVGNNCNVVDISTCDKEKGKIFSVVRKYKNYKFDLDFKILIKNGFYPEYMTMFDKKDEVIFKCIK